MPKALTKNTARRKRSHRSSVARESLLQLFKTPLNLALNVILIAIAISLPITLDLSVANFKAWAGYNDNDLEITIYLNQQLADHDANKLKESILQWPGVDRARYVSREQALESLKQVELFSGALDGLVDNPLPPSIVVFLPHETRIVELAKDLIEKAEKTEGVDWVLFDLDWFNKAQAIIDTGSQVNAVLSAFLSLSVCLVIGNCVRLTIDHRREEILVSKLVGATDNYVRKPFLYMGMWVGILGAFTGIMLCGIAWWLLSNQMGSLGLAYGTDIQLVGLQLSRVLAIVFSCAVFGLLGAWVICNRQLRNISP